MSEENKRPTKIRVTNITRNPGACFLDPGEKYGNKLIAPGHSMFFDCPNGNYPECTDAWIQNKQVRIEDANSGTLLSGAPISGEITPGLVSPVRPMSGSRDDDMDPFGEDDINLDDAREAVLPGQLAGHSPVENRAPMRPDTRQMQGNARVSLGTRDEGNVVAGELSPIPGDRPRSVDESDKFTIKAPRSHSVGAVIGKR